MIKPLKYTKVPLNYPADLRVEMFSEAVSRSYFYDWQTLTIAKLAHDFRRHFHVDLAMTTGQLTTLLRRLRVEIVFNPEIPSSIYAEWHFNLRKKEYEIQTGWDNGEQRESLLHELFEIIFWRCYFNAPWWKLWMQMLGIREPHQIADEFASEVLVPTMDFQHWAVRMGYDTFGMAGYFNINPVICTRTMQRAIAPKCPIFTAHLHYIPEQDIQGKLYFDDPYVRAEVKTCFRKRPVGKPKREWGNAIDVLAQRFPRRSRWVDVDGVFYDALHQGKEVRLHTDTLAGINLPEPVYAVFRTGGSKEQATLQVVPAGYEDLLQSPYKLEPLYKWAHIADWER